MPLKANSPVLRAFQSSNVPSPFAIFTTASAALNAPIPKRAFLKGLATFLTLLTSFAVLPAAPNPGNKVTASNPRFIANDPISFQSSPSRCMSAAN